VILACSVLLSSVGNSEGDNIVLQRICKFVAAVSIQLHEGEVEHKFVKTNEGSDYN
jgi:hypothetical protein